jgi:hypothetical protein
MFPACDTYVDQYVYVFVLEMSVYGNIRQNITLDSDTSNS